MAAGPGDHAPLPQASTGAPALAAAAQRPGIAAEAVLDPRRRRGRDPSLRWPEGRSRPRFSIKVWFEPGNLRWSPHPDLNRRPRSYQLFRCQRCGTYQETASETHQIMVWCVFAGLFFLSRTTQMAFSRPECVGNLPRRSSTQSDARREGKTRLQHTRPPCWDRLSRSAHRLAVAPALRILLVGCSLQPTSTPARRRGSAPTGRAFGTHRRVDGHHHVDQRAMERRAPGRGCPLRLVVDAAALPGFRRRIHAGVNEPLELGLVLSEHLALQRDAEVERVDRQVEPAFRPHRQRV